MKIDLFDMKEFVSLNHLQEVTSPVLFQRGDVPHPNGLISNQIFGVTTKSRKETFAYIDLAGHFFHPHVYKALKRFYRNIEKIVNGELYVSIGKDGTLVKDEEKGDTGLEFLYQNWEKIKWQRANDSGMRNERIDLITKFKKDEIFIQYQLVIPAFYRDIKPDQKGGGETDDINNMYAKLIRFATLLKDKNMFDFQFHTTNFNMQNTLVDIYNYFKVKIEKKNGLLRKYLMGKNVDYCTRSVITCTSMHANHPKDMMVNMTYSTIPIPQICSLAYPFMFHWIKGFIQREIIDNQTAKVLYNPATDEVVSSMELDSPESFFSEKYIKKMMDTYIKDPESRFNKIEVPTKDGKVMYLAFTGKRLDPATKSEIAGIAQRPMTWTDLLYIAASDVVKDKCALITRYPLLDEFGVFISKIRVSSTTETDLTSYNNEVYKWYPHVEFGIPPEKIATKFIDSIQFSNSYLPGLDGDLTNSSRSPKTSLIAGNLTTFLTTNS